MKVIPVEDMTIERLRVEYRSLYCLVGIKDALIVDLKHQLAQSQQEATAAKSEANGLRQELIGLHEQQRKV